MAFLEARVAQALLPAEGSRKSTKILRFKCSLVTDIGTQIVFPLARRAQSLP